MGRWNVDFGRGVCFSHRSCTEGQNWGAAKSFMRDRQLCKTAAVSWIEFEQRLWGECKMHLSKRFQSVRLATRVNREKPWHMCGIWTDVKALPTNINDLQDLRQKFLECFQKTNIHYKLSPATFTKLFFPCRLKNTFAQPWN